MGCCCLNTVILGGEPKKGGGNGPPPIEPNCVGFFAGANPETQILVPSQADPPTQLVTGVELFDEGGFYNVATFQWTPPAGLINIGGAVEMISVGTARLIVSIGKNAARFASGSSGSNNIADSPQAHGVDVIDLANGTDVYTMAVQQQSGISQLTNGGVFRTYFWGACVGVTCTEGIGTMPCVGFGAFTGSAQFLPAGAPNLINFGLSEFQEGGGYNGSNRYTPQAGLVKISASVRMQTPGAGISGQTQIFKNGVIFAGGDLTSNNNSAQDLDSIVSVVDLADGVDFYEIFYFHDSISQEQTDPSERSVYFTAAHVGVTCEPTP